VKKILPILLLSAASVWSQPAIPAPTTGDGMVAISPRGSANLTEAELNKVLGKDEINLKGATIDEFLTVYAETVNRTILRPATLPAPTITLRNQTALTKREAIQLFDAVLGINGIAIINVGDKFAKAVPVAQANQEGAPILQGDASTLSDMGQYVTHVVQLKYVKPSEMLPIIQPFAKIPNSILPVEANGILVIRDFSENVKRMLEMIAKVDVSVPAEYISEVIPIKYALAGDIATALNSLSGSSGGTSVGSSSGGGARGSANRTSSRGAFGSGGGIGGTGSYNQTGQTGQMGGVGTVGGGSGGTFTERIRNIINRASAPTTSGDITVIGETKIIADERTNSLLVYATRQDMETIKDVISKLDVVLAQVLIESIILGVAATDDLEYGVSAAQKPRAYNDTLSGAGIMNNDKGSLVGNLADLFATNALSSGGLNWWGNVNDEWLVAVKALSSRGKTEVLQRPVIMTTHATPGQFFVGNTVPYVTSSYYGGSSIYGPSSSYQQLRVGIQLTVTPFINPDGIVVMKIDQAIEEIDGSTKIEGVGDVPNTASRTLSADVTVRDRDTIVLGGFIRTSGTKTRSGVPILKDIPLLGALFSDTSNNKDRRELLVLMRPTVLKTPELAAMGSKIERERMPGISRFEKNIVKEQSKFDEKMDELDKVGEEPEVLEKDKPEDPPVQSLFEDIYSTPPPIEEKQPAAEPQSSAPAPAAPAAQASAAQAAPAAEQPAESTVETEWTKPSTTKETTAAKKGTGSDFKKPQPMTDEELKAYRQ